MEAFISAMPVIVCFILLIVLILSYYTYKLWHYISPEHNTNPPPPPPSGNSIDLFVTRSTNGDRWILVANRGDKNEVGPVRVRQGQTINYSFDPPQLDLFLHPQFPEDNLFTAFPCIDPWIPTPRNSISLDTDINGRNLGSHKYCLAVLPHNQDDQQSPLSPYVAGGSPPEIIIERE